jgi:hypothetical protein
MSAATRVPALQSLWERATGRTWSTGGGIMVRQPLESERQREEVQEALQSLSPSAPADVSAAGTTLGPAMLSALLEQLLALQRQTKVAELTTREALTCRKTAKHLLAAPDLLDALSRRRHNRRGTPSTGVRGTTPGRSS